MLKLLLVFCLVFAVGTPLFAGGNPSAKVAVHILAHDGVRRCEDLPISIAHCDFSYTYWDCGEVDVFPVFIDLDEYWGVEYGMTWPEEWGTCMFTPCNDGVTIMAFDCYGAHDAFDPGDGMSQAWSSCMAGPCALPGWGWFTASTGGLVCVVRHPMLIYEEAVVLDCGEVRDQVNWCYCGGVCGVMGDDPSEGHSSVEEEGWGQVKALFR
jgi:hypothetical protein